MVLECRMELPVSDKFTHRAKMLVAVMTGRFQAFFGLVTNAKMTEKVRKLNQECLFTLRNLNSNDGIPSSRSRDKFQPSELVRKGA